MPPPPRTLPLTTCGVVWSLTATRDQPSSPTSRMSPVATDAVMNASTARRGRTLTSGHPLTVPSRYGGA
jgi:hypothetical protein